MNWKVNPYPFFSGPQVGVVTLFLCVFLTTMVIAGCGPSPSRELTLDEAKVLKYRVSVDGIAFNVPVNYHYREYAMFKRWPSPIEGEAEGKARRKVDVIKVDVLLPNMEPYTEVNAREFERPGWGNTLWIFMSKRSIDWDYYFKNVWPRLQKSNDQNIKIAGMTKYHDPVAGKIVYLSHRYPTNDISRIVCPIVRMPPDPSCTGVSPYLDRFHVETTFSNSHLAKWRMVDSQARNLLDGFRDRDSNSK